MKIREGAYYRARNGQLIGPMKINSDEPDRPWHDDAMMTWPDNGKYDDDPDLKTDINFDGFDLISEVYVSDTPPALAVVRTGGGGGGGGGGDAPAPETKTLRDEFAMAALQGMLARDDFHARDVARDAYEYAYEMMEARKK